MNCFSIKFRVWFQFSKKGFYDMIINIYSKMNGGNLIIIIFSNFKPFIKLE